MAEVQVLRLSNRHESILEYMLANPTVKLGDVAARFDMTQSWLSILVHSDVFQDALAKKRHEVWHPAMMTLQERLTAVAHLSLDKLGEAMDNDKLSPGQLIEASGGVLDRLGYGTKAPASGGGGVTINQFGVPAGTLEQARENFGKRVERVPQEEVTNVEPESDHTSQPRIEASGTGNGG